ncbi:MAG: hypothetical protein Q9216_001576 [Gyalolechia sp. 2 TL-2023]
MQELPDLNLPPEDQAVLEEAYKQNPKPDKTVRAELARRVSLGERELSIWFQNKRQVSRRRSRPLTSDELFAAVNSSQDSAVSASCGSAASSQELLSSQTSSNSAASHNISGLERQALSSKASDTTLPASIIKEPKALVPLHNDSFQQINASQTSYSVLKNERTKSSALSSDLHIDPASVKLKTIKAPRKQRHASFALFDECQSETPVTTPGLPAPLKRTTSQPRLSTSLSGSVRIKTGISPSPSPPRPHSLNTNPQPRSSGPLQRSQSAMVTSTSPSARPVASFGRSKDSRSWQFFCDSAGKDELSKQAELEQKGSAAGAINLLRCKSKGSFPTDATNINPNKRTATSTKLEGQKRVKKEGGATAVKPKLSRALSSAARLQNPTSLTSKHSNSKLGRQAAATTTKVIINTDDKDPKKKTTSIDIFNDGNESDKENWAPGTEVSVAPRRRPHRPHGAAASRTKILGENPYMSSQSVSLNPRNGNAGNRSVPRAPQIGKENKHHCNVDDDEVEAFMSGGNGFVGEEDNDDDADDEEDLNCVQGLLSLSQGAWR